ncbi:hypothetical protein SCHPADRAFT_280139 [Schizopora paradoxa]|uniref:Uncharacterized protein n=1 Tax=Schizopora paradoxa TaxID=27342 RepID=A0A0H2SDM5_9AGAM|nr:hypothetical protein SCHPADRAFT_280139 [Schizopora paradoxa]
MPFSSSESHLDFSSDDSDEDEVDEGKIEPFPAGAGIDDSFSSFSDCCSDDRDSDQISFVLRESARLLIEDVEFRDPVMHYETSWRSNFEPNVLDTLDEQLKNDPRASWTAICWREAAPEEQDAHGPLNPRTSSQDTSSTLRPQTTRLLTNSLNVRRHITNSHSPVTPGDPILGGTPPLSMTPRSPIPRSPAAGTLGVNPLDFAIAAPVPRYRPMSDPPPYSASASPATWTEFSSRGHSKTCSPFTSEASDADNEASTDSDDLSDSRTFTERSSDFDSSSSSDRRSNSDPSLDTTASHDASSCPSPSPSPAPSSFLLPHAYSFSSALAKYSSSPSICGPVGAISASTSALLPQVQRGGAEVFAPSTLAGPASTGHSPPSSSLSSPLERSLPFPLFSAPKPSESVNFAPERPTSPPAHHSSSFYSHHHSKSHLKTRSGLFFAQPKPLSGTWKASRDRTSSEDPSALQRFASRCGTLSRKLTTVAAGGVR